jgi:AraC-like DNA-binding protein
MSPPPGSGADRVLPGRFQVLPPLSPEQFGALKADIAERGVLVPIEVDETGQVLDGHHRCRAWQELRTEGVRVPPYPRVVRQLPDEHAKVAHALRLNLSRRHLSRLERAEVVAALRDRHWSLRRIGGALGVSRETVARDLAGDTSVTPDFVVGSDGKHYQAKQLSRPPSIPAHSARDERRAIDVLSDLGDDAPHRTIELRRAEAKARVLRLSDIPEPDGRVVTGPSWRVECVRLEDLAVPDHSVDLVLTDPPYTNVPIPAFSYTQSGVFVHPELRR